MSQTKVGNFFELFNGNARTVYQIMEVDLPCSSCGDNDMVKMKVVTNNDEGLISSLDQYTLPDDKVGNIFYQCEKQLWNDVRKSNNTFVAIPESMNASFEKRILDFSNL